MHVFYDDIQSKLGRPQWWYRNDAAIPRYAPFSPDLCGVYDTHAALLEIRCQACREIMPVSMSLWKMDLAGRDENGKMQFPLITLPTAESAGSFDRWNDPPIHGCTGDTMCSDLVRILEFWMQEDPLRQWVRHSELEFDYSHLLDREEL